jgi:hypothetical protein
MVDAVSSTVAEPGAGLRAAAWLGFALLLVTVFGAAFIRFAQGDAALEGAAEIARWVYRVAAIVFVLVVAGMAVLGWEALRSGSRLVLGAQIALAVALTFLGRITPSSDHPLIAFGNPLGGLALVGLAWWIVLAASPGADRRPRRPLAGAALAAAAFLALATIVVWPVGIAAGLVVQLVAAALLVAGITLLHGRGD